MALVNQRARACLSLATDMHHGFGVIISAPGAQITYDMRQRGCGGPATHRNSVQQGTARALGSARCALCRNHGVQGGGAQQRQRNLRSNGTET